LTKFYDQSYNKKDKQRVVREVTTAVLSRAPKLCNFVEYKVRAPTCGVLTPLLAGQEDCVQALRLPCVAVVRAPLTRLV